MRIISDFHDYYDVCRRHGQDDDILYLRKEEVESPPNATYYLRSRWSWFPYEVMMDDLIVGFCGNIYPTIHCSVRSTTFQREWEDKWCYSHEAVDEWIFKHGMKRIRTWYTKPEYRRGKTPQYYVEQFFVKQLEKQEEHKEKFEKAPIFTLQSNKVTYNARLEGLDFVTQFDPYLAFQELQMYLGAKARPEKPIPKIPDKIMVEAKGFDKHSFRKEPGKKKRGKK